MKPPPAEQPERPGTSEAQRLSATKETHRKGGAGAVVDPDTRGLLLDTVHDPGSPYVIEKKRARGSFVVENDLVRLVTAHLMCSGIWLFWGTLVGLYLSLKFLWPDLDHISWLSFGRLRPVHTNMVFWGWATMTMVGLGYFVISRTSNAPIYRIRQGWWALGLMNVTVVIGSVLLMLGVNNGGGEYREYIWPAAVPLAIGLLLTTHNYYQTIARRKTKEIYISNWFILAACSWTLILIIIGYLPFYQDGLGETIIQGYYMHQGVGMWFMTFTLGLAYFFIPSALNKPIYSYSLGVLAFWTQLLFYTMIGTHHFVFSPLPHWLQNVAIVFSAGMFIPVVSGTTNFLMTMRGSWKSISGSYSLPFLLVGVISYFLGSAQGSFQALRSTNLIWHFTDFNVAHSHVTMYGIISFFLWGMIYALIPKLPYREPKQGMVGIHFWFSVIGLLFYSGSLMIGGTLKGLSWLNDAPFIESVVLMAPYWIWRAVGGSLMFIAHIVFLYNLYDMTARQRQPDALQPTPTR